LHGTGVIKQKQYWTPIFGIHSEFRVTERALLSVIFNHDLRSFALWKYNSSWDRIAADRFSVTTRHQ
jgi:hypothetical protein